MAKLPECGCHQFPRESVPAVIRHLVSLLHFPKDPDNLPAFYLTHLPHPYLPHAQETHCCGVSCFSTTGFLGFNTQTPMMRDL